MATKPSEGNFLVQLKALASEASCKIIGVLASHKPAPVPVRVLSEELGFKQSTVSMHLRRLRNARLVQLQSRRKGYSADSEEIKAVIGLQSYTRITQDLRARNEDTPG